ncbi:hypothetical protein F7725_000965 [Dissostichus mawsoni]|uniref:Prostaglandin E synthase 3 n=1 Tax=Dissostichus mawsoni TaxID=36200 RepID=A0A7J5ZGE1_DISMA|nr:hypothetical protein F7725_000965 [Dissostichus mawsoni]
MNTLETSSTFQLRQCGHSYPGIRNKIRSRVHIIREAFALLVSGQHTFPFICRHCPSFPVTVLSTNKKRTSRRDMHPATAKWYDRRDCVFIEFCVADSKDLKIDFDKTKCGFSCLAGTDDVKHENEMDLFEAIDENESKHKRTDRSVLLYLKKAQPGKPWPRLTKEKAKCRLQQLERLEDDSDEEMGNFDQFSDMMNTMGGEEDIPDLDGGAEDDESADSDDESSFRLFIKYDPPFSVGACPNDTNV